MSNTLVLTRGEVNMQRGKTNTVAIHVLCVVIAAALAFAMVLMVGDAAGTASSSITAGVKSGTQQLFDIIKAVVAPIAAVCFAWNALKALFGGERGMEQAKHNVLIIILVLAMVFLAPVVINEVAGWFSGSSTWLW